MQEKIYLLIKKIELFYYFIFSLIKIVRIFFFSIQAFLVIMDNKVYSSAKKCPLVCLHDLLCSTERKHILINIF